MRESKINTINIQYYKSPFGELIMGSYHGKLCLCDWRYRKMRTTIDKRIQQGINADYINKDDEVLSLTKQQLSEYLNGQRTIFDIPLLLIGTEFQKLVWNKLLQIPYGETLTYAELAKKIGNDEAVRAVASANGANAISIIVPCHRIIGTNGNLTGYAGGIRIKKKLLDIEKKGILLKERNNI